MFTSRPAVKFCLPFIAGIIIGWKIPFNIQSVFCGLMISACLFILFHKKAKGLLITDLYMIALCMGFGVLKITYDTRCSSDDSVSKFPFPDSLVILICKIVDEPFRSEYSVKFTADAEGIVFWGDTIRTSGSVVISWYAFGETNPEIKCFRSGMRLSLPGRMVENMPVRNPGEFDYASYMKLNNLDGRFNAAVLDSGCIIEREGGGFLSRYVYPVRRALATRIDSLIGGAEGRFLRGLLLGERSYIPTDVKTAFINAGVMHVVAVSGLHVVIVAGMIVFFLQIVRIPNRVRYAAAAILLVYYAFLTGGTPSVVRSVIMAIIYLTANYFERKTDIYNILSISAIIILLVDSKQLFHPGFQLSFVSVLSIVYVYPRINIFSGYSRDDNILMRLMAYAWSLIAASFAASIGTLPFVALYFGKISIIGIVANIIIVPLSNAVLAVGMISVSVSYVMMYAASVYAEVARLLTIVLLDMVQVFGKMPFSHVQSKISHLAILFYYCVIGMCIMLFDKKTRRKGLILLLVLANMILYNDILNQKKAAFRVSFLDIGQGDAIVLELPDGKNIVVDAGPQFRSFNGGEHVVLPYLRERGIRKINGLILTHRDADHIGGCSAVIRGIKTEEFMESGKSNNGFLSDQTDYLIDSLGLKRATAVSGMIFGGSSNWRMYALHPLESRNIENPSSNESSVVVKVVYGYTSVLLTGDIHAQNEAELVSIYGSFLKSDILKLGHHGSASSTSLEFLNHVRPAVSIISVGRRNRFGHPSSLVLDRLRENNYALLRTDVEGAIIFESDGDNWERIEWR